MKIIFGQYIPNNTFIHHLDPRTKILSMFSLMTIVFLNVSLLANVVATLLIFCLIIVAKIAISSIINAIKPLFFMFIFLLIFNIYLIRTGPVVFVLPLINASVHLNALVQTMFIFWRIALVVCLSLTLTSTTDPMRLTLGLEKLCSPLKKIKVPVAVFAMMISIALRFIPTLMEEADKIIKAQASRGLDFYNGSLKTKVKAIVALIIPLLVSSFNKADMLALAMEAKNYDPQVVRVHYRNIYFSLKDIIAFIFVATIVTLFVFAKLGYISL